MHMFDKITHCRGVFLFNYISNSKHISFETQRCRLETSYSAMPLNLLLSINFDKVFSHCKSAFRLIIMVNFH